MKNIFCRSKYAYGYKDTDSHRKKDTSTGILTHKKIVKKYKGIFVEMAKNANFLLEKK